MAEDFTSRTVAGAEAAENRRGFAEAMRSGIDDEPDIYPDDRWQTKLEAEQQREADEIVMMVDQLHEKGVRIDYAYRGYDNLHMVVLEGEKCYGLSPKVHAFLSGASAIANTRR